MSTLSSGITRVERKRHMFDSSKRTRTGAFKCNHGAFRQTLCSIDTYNPPIGNKKENASETKAPPEDVSIPERQSPKYQNEREKAECGCTSVLKLSPVQLEATAEAREHRQRVARSKWTELCDLDVLLSDQEHRDRCLESQKAKRNILSKETGTVQRFIADLQREALYEQLEQKRQEQEIMANELEAEKRRIQAALGRDEQHFKEKQRAQRAKNEEMKASILSEIDRSRQRRQSEAENLKSDHMTELKQAVAFIKLEKEREDEKKQMKIAEMERYIEENKERAIQKKQETERKAKRDAQLMQETLQFLDEQEKQRVQSLRARYARIEAKTRIAGDTVVKEAHLQEVAETRRIKRQQDDHESKLRHAEAKKEERRREEMDYLLRCLESQKKEKENERLKKIESSKLEAAKIELRAQEFKQQTAQKLIEERRKNSTHQTELLKQIEEKKSSRLKTGIDMNEQEYRLNRRLILDALQRLRVTGCS